MTVNEIRFNRQDRREYRLSDFCDTRFRKGDIVEFIFNGLRKIGRITTIFLKGDTYLYNIETRSHQWFQKISQENITNIITQN